MLVSTGASDAFDLPIMRLVRAPALDAPLAPLRHVTELGSTWAVTAVALIVFATGAAIGPWRHGLIGGLTIALASVGNSALKMGVARARPDILEPLLVEHGFSFPSGHALLGAAAYGVLAVLIARTRLPAVVRRSLIVGLVALVILIGLSRVWLGVHYPSDVLAGWIAGSLVVLLYATLTRGVSREPAEGAADAGRAGPRSDPPVAR